MSRVLISDKAALFQMLEPSFLRRAAWKIDRASEPREVLETAHRQPPDLIVIQMESPDEETPGCLGALKADPRLRPIPVIVIASENDVARCREAGADATLTHPVAPEALTSALCMLARVPHRGGGRAPARIAARIDAPSGHFHGRVKDISESGIFLALPETLPLHTSLDVQLVLPVRGRRRRIRVAGEIVRQVSPDPDSHLISGVGVRFTAIDPCAQDWIRIYVEDASRDDASPGLRNPDDPEMA